MDDEFCSLIDINAGHLCTVNTAKHYAGKAVLPQVG